MKKSRAFSLVELLVALIVIAVGLVAIIGTMRTAINYTDRLRQEVVAINLAREGMEAVYSIRNSALLRRSGRRDQNWLCTDPVGGNNTTSQGSGCGEWMTNNQSYILSLSGTATTPYYLLRTADSPIVLTGLLDLSDGITTDKGFFVQYGLRPNTALGTGWYNRPYRVSDALPNQSEGRFFRQILTRYPSKGLGLYQKDTNAPGGNYIGNCTGSNQASSSYIGRSITGAAVTKDCYDTGPKEFRFCTRVEYQKQTRGRVELCGAMTNYEE